MDPSPNTSDISPLHGSCSCGRNQFLIALPSDPIRASSLASIIFDDSAESRLTHSTPLPTFLRIPLTTLQSTTFAFHPDESHASIKRSFTPRHAPDTKRSFCGFCGTQLSYWSEGGGSARDEEEEVEGSINEEDGGEAEWICINLGSLEGGSVRILEGLGVFEGLVGNNLGEEELEEPEGAEEREEKPLAAVRSELSATPVVAEASLAVPAGPSTAKHISRVSRQGNKEVRGQPWFEEIIEGTRLGRIKRRRGGKVSHDGRERVEWSVVEYEEGDMEGEEAEQELGGEEGERGGKRKAGEISGEEDVVMRGGN